jgi:hypothetical protein
VHAPEKVMAAQRGWSLKGGAPCSACATAQNSCSRKEARARQLPASGREGWEPWTHLEDATTARLMLYAYIAPPNLPAELLNILRWG